MRMTNCHLIKKDGSIKRYYTTAWWAQEIELVTNWSPIQVTKFVATGEFWYNCPVFREKECVDVP